MPKEKQKQHIKMWFMDQDDQNQFSLFLHEVPLDKGINIYSS